MTLSELVPADATLISLLDDLDVRCSHAKRGCEWNGPRGNHAEHLERSCAFHRCALHPRGCPWLGSRSRIEEHRNTCAYVDLSCPHIGYCAWLGERRLLQEHLTGETTCAGVARQQEEARKEADQRRYRQFAFELACVSPTKEEDIVRLNVGGRLFTTTRGTLRKCPESKLALLFSGCHELGKDDTGAYFLDRDGDAFAVMLNWLRSGTLPASSSPIIQAEASFWQLPALLAALPKLDAPPPSYPLSPDRTMLWVQLSRAPGAKLVLPGADLRGLYLLGVDLSEAVLTGCRMNGVVLRGATLVRCDLRGADLSSADLSSADLSGSNLGGAKLTRTNMSDARLGSSDANNKQFVCDLADVDVSEAIGFDQAFFLGTHLTRVKGLQGYNFSANKIGTLRIADTVLDHVSFEGCTLTGVNFSTAVVSESTSFAGARFLGVDDPNGRYARAVLPRSLKGANFAGATLALSQLNGVDTSRANFTKAHFVVNEALDVLLAPCLSLLGAKFRGERNYGRKLDSLPSDLSSVEFRHVTFAESVDLSSSILRGTIFDHVDLSALDLSSVNFAGAQIGRNVRFPGGTVQLPRCQKHDRTGHLLNGYLTCGASDAYDSCKVFIFDE